VGAERRATVASDVAKRMDSGGSGGRFEPIRGCKPLTMDVGGISGRRASELRTRRLQCLPLPLCHELRKSTSASCHENNGTSVGTEGSA
jgi:hypothetical protein